MNDLNEAARFFGFIAQKVIKSQPKKEESKEEKDERIDTNNKGDIDCMLNNYLNGHQRVIDILSSIDDLNEDDVLTLLHSFQSIQSISNASIEQLSGRTPLNREQINSIYKTFNTTQKQLDSA